MGRTQYVILISSVAAIGGFLFGFDSGVINGTVDALQDAFGSSTAGTGFSVASMLLGCAVGAVIAGAVADRFGRKPTMIATAIAFLISAIGSGIASGVPDFIIYRLIGGVAVGAASVVAPTYISEVAPAETRGRLASLQQLAIVIGLFVAFLSNYLLAKASGGAREEFWMGFHTWRWMFWVECVPAVAYFLGALIIPESPRYLVAKSQTEVAKIVLAKSLKENIDEKIQEIKRSLGGFIRPSVRDVFVSGTVRVRPVIWVGVGLSVFQQFVGINVIFYYGSTLWQAAGLTEDRALLINVISGVINISATVVAIMFVDKLGRKPLLLFGSIGMAITLGTMAVVFGMSGLDESGNLALSKTNGIVALIAANLYVFSFGTSWGPVVWVMLGEMFSNRFRGAALGFAASAQWIANFVITMSFPIMLAKIGLAGAYGFYTLSAIVSVGFILMFIKETKGMQLEEM